MFVTQALLPDLAPIASAEGVAMARGLLYLAAVLAVWTLFVAIRHLTKVVTALFRATLVLLALAAAGTVAVAVIAQLALILRIG